MTTLIDRLTEIMAAKDWTHADLVRVSGQSHSVVSQWLGHGSKIIKTIGKLDAAVRIEAESGFAALWIATGQGPKYASRPALHLVSDSSGTYTAGPAAPTVGEALTRIGVELARDLPDYARDDLADEMSKWVRRRGAEHSRQRVLQLITESAGTGTSGKPS